MSQSKKKKEKKEKKKNKKSNKEKKATQSGQDLTATGEMRDRTREALPADGRDATQEPAPEPSPAKPERMAPVPATVDVKQIRTAMNLTQQQFADHIGASVHAVRHWENGRRTPAGTARTLLCVLRNDPNAVLDALGRPQE